MNNESITCANCGSDDVVAKPKGFDSDRAALGGLFFGLLGFLYGGYKNKNEVMVHCRSCNMLYNYNDGLVVDRKASRKLFYSLYESGNYEEAGALYRSVYRQEGEVCDLNEAYVRLKAEDRKSLMITLSFIVFVIVMLILVMLTA